MKSIYNYVCRKLACTCNDCGCGANCTCRNCE